MTNNTVFIISIITIIVVLCFIGYYFYRTYYPKDNVLQSNEVVETTTTIPQKEFQIGKEYTIIYPKSDEDNPFEEQDVKNILIRDKKDGYIKYSYKYGKEYSKYTCSSKESLLKRWAVELQ